MTYIIDLNDGRSYFLKLEESEYIRIQPVKECAIVNIFDDKKPGRPKLIFAYTGVEKFTLVSDA